MRIIKCPNGCEKNWEMTYSPDTNKMYCSQCCNEFDNDGSFEKALTVKQLIDVLNQHDSSLLVMIEGCDCVGYAIDVTTYTSYNDIPAILIGRHPES